MADELRLQVVTPKGSFVDAKVVSVTTRSDVGELTMLPGHRPILASLKPGPLYFVDGLGEKGVFVVDRGFLEGGPDHAHVVTERCIAVADIDAEAVKKQVEELEREPEADADTRNLIEIEWAQAQLEAAASAS